MQQMQALVVSVSLTTAPVSYTHLDVYKRQILHYLPKSRKLNTTEQFEIYRYHTLQPNNILNEQLHYKSHTLFDTLIHTHLSLIHI